MGRSAGIRRAVPGVVRARLRSLRAKAELRRRARFLRRLPQGAVCAEIGVFRGEFTDRILSETRPRELHLIDGWWQIYGERFPHWWAPQTADGALRTRQAHAETLAVIDRHGARERCHVHVGEDLAILEGFADGFFDWVYLDTSHETGHTLRELAVLDRKVAANGLIAGDDWHPTPGGNHPGVATAVNEFLTGGGWALEVVDARGQWLLRRSGAS